VNIDLHIHSTASDGTLTPTEILKLSQKLNLGAFSITDHDTVDGSKEILINKQTIGTQFLTGVELSVSPLTSFQEPGTFHILGYGIDVDDGALNKSLNLLRTARRNRNPEIIQKLNTLGIHLSIDAVLEQAGETDLVGRPHIAQAMVKKGYAASIDDAFDTFLAVGKPAYVDKFRLDCKQAIEILRGAGGIPVLAHPFLLKLKPGVGLEAFIIELKSMGLGGIEVHYPKHTPEQVHHYAEIAMHNDLLMTGGTDFHGALTPEIQIGSGNGDLSVPYELYEKIASLIKQ